MLREPVNQPRNALLHHSRFQARVIGVDRYSNPEGAGCAVQYSPRHHILSIACLCRGDPAQLCSILTVEGRLGNRPQSPFLQLHARGDFAAYRSTWWGARHRAVASEPPHQPLPGLRNFAPYGARAFAEHDACGDALHLGKQRRLLAAGQQFKPYHVHHRTRHPPSLQRWSSHTPWLPRVRARS